MSPKNVTTKKRGPDPSSQGPLSGPAQSTSSSASSPAVIFAEGSKALLQMTKIPTAPKPTEAFKWLAHCAVWPNVYHSLDTEATPGGQSAKTLTVPKNDIVPSASVQAVDLTDLVATPAGQDLVMKWRKKGLEILQNAGLHALMEKWEGPPRNTTWTSMGSEGNVTLATFKDVIYPLVQMLNGYLEIKGEDKKRGSIIIDGQYDSYGINTKNQEISGRQDFVLTRSNNAHRVQPGGPARPFINWECKPENYMGKIIIPDANSATGWTVHTGRFAQLLARLRYIYQQQGHYAILNHQKYTAVTDGVNFFLKRWNDLVTYQLGSEKQTPKGKKMVDLITMVPKDVTTCIVPHIPGSFPIILGFCCEALEEEEKFDHKQTSSVPALKGLLEGLSITAAQHARDEAKAKKAGAPKVVVDDTVN